MILVVRLSEVARLDTLRMIIQSCAHPQKGCAQETKTHTTICYAPTSDLDNIGPYLALKLREMDKN